MTTKLRVSYPTQGYMDYFNLRLASQVKSKVMQGMPPRNGCHHKTMRSCIGMMNMATAGYVVYCPWTFTMRYENDDWTLEYPENYDPPVHPMLNIHPAEQHKGYMEDYAVLKISLPITCREKSGINFMFHGANLHNFKLNGDMSVVSGITDFKYNETVNVFVMLKKVEGAEYKFESGDALMQMIPMSEQDIEMEEVVGVTRDFDGMNFFPSAVKSCYFGVRNFLNRIGE